MSDFFIDHSEEGYGSVLVPRGPWRPEYRQLLMTKQVIGVRLSSSMGWRSSDVTFLKELPDLRVLEIYVSEVRDASVISSLPELRVLGLQCDLRSEVDFSALTKLEVVKAAWKPALQGLLGCTTLKQLNLMKWPGIDLGGLSKLTRIARLQLTSNTLRTLHGLTELLSLRILDLDACPKLRSLEDVAGTPSIQQVEVTSCRSVRSIAALSALRELRVAILDDNAEIDSLRPLAPCHLLEELSFVGSTRITDGKISAIEHLPRLRSLRFSPRVHYDRRHEDLLSS
ncbi:MAG: hypothetical protein H0W42_12270 [Gemmatimonadaceae bacterium]|nr:hypothetical protein [Gemmatimonadaceae bacterium]